MAVDHGRDAASGPIPGVSVPGDGRAGSTARWTAAVTLGGQGRYAAAAALLEDLVRDRRTPRALRAHALVTRASHLRQQGGHGLAARLDGQALALTGLAADGPLPEDAALAPDPCADLGSARVDALVGLAADALGRFDLTASDTLLTRADTLPAGWRPRVRRYWVRAELALARGDLDAAARAAVAAVEGSAGSLRHLLKSRLIAAVARRLREPDQAALAELEAIAAAAGAAGLLPLRWAALLAAADTADALAANGGAAARVGPPAAESQGCTSGAKPHPPVIVGPPADTRPSGGPERPSTRPNGSVGSHDRRRGEMRESTNGAPNDAARLRHAAGLALSVIRDRSDTRGRRLMGGAGSGA
jgi:hypothetical protein